MLAEISVTILLLALLVWPSVLKRSSTKLAFLAVVAYLSHKNLLLGILAAAVLLRVLQPPAFWRSWQPPHIDRLGLDSLMRPQESFFRPVIRTPGEPMAEVAEPYTLF
jgi:hypothetical protein